MWGQSPWSMRSKPRDARKLDTALMQSLDRNAGGMVNNECSNCLVGWCKFATWRRLQFTESFAREDFTNLVSRRADFLDAACVRRRNENLVAIFLRRFGLRRDIRFRYQMPMARNDVRGLLPPCFMKTGDETFEARSRAGCESSGCCGQ